MADKCDKTVIIENFVLDEENQKESLGNCWRFM